VDQNKKDVLTTSIIAAAVVAIFFILCLTWFMVDREAYRNGYVPYENGAGAIKIGKKPE